MTVSCWEEIYRLCCFVFLCVPIACSVLLGSAVFPFHLELSWDLMGAEVLKKHWLQHLKEQNLDICPSPSWPNAVIIMEPKFLQVQARMQCEAYSCWQGSGCSGVCSHLGDDVDCSRSQNRSKARQLGREQGQKCWEHLSTQQ